MIYRILICLLVIPLFIGCKTTSGPSDLIGGFSFLKSAEQKEGEAALTDGEFDRAVDLFQQAAQKKPDDKKIASLLSLAQSKASEMHTGRARQAEMDNDPKLAFEEYQKAFQSQETPQTQENLTRSQKRYQQLSLEVAAVLADLQKTQDIPTTIQRAEKLRVYRRSFPNLESSLQEARQTAGKAYSQEADSLLSQRRLTQALTNARLAAELSGTSDYDRQINAIEAVIEARDKARSSDLEAALASAKRAVEYLPHNQAIAQYHAELYEEASGQLFNQAMKASRNGRYLDAIRHLTDLQALNPDFPETDQLLRQNRLRFSDENRRRAEALELEQQSQAAGRILMHYLIAQHYDPNAYELEEAIMRTRKRLSDEIELRVSIDFSNQSREPGANTYIRDRVLDGLRDSNIRNLTVLEREAIDEILREQGLGQGFLDESTTLQVKKIRGIQTGVKGSVLRVDIRESGRDRPSYDSVRYQSGTRFVPNPAYRERQANVSRAQQRVYRAQQELNNARSKRQNTPNAGYDPKKSTLSNQLGALNQVLADGQVTSAERAVRDAQYDLDNAQNALMNEPSQVEQVVYADARYPIYNLRLDGEVMISFRIIDFTTSEIGRSHSIHTKDSVSDRYVAGDPGKGIDDDPNELPPPGIFKEQLLDRAVQETTAKISEEFSRFSERFLEQARRARERGIDDDAAELYFRYLTALSDMSSEGAIEARSYLDAKFGDTAVYLGGDSR